MLPRKVAIITGAAQGLGKSFAEVLLKRGAKVCVADVNSEVGQATAEQLCEMYERDSAFFIDCDVRDENQFEDVFKETMKRYNAIDIVCNNAGIMHEGKWEEMLDINLKAVIRGVHLGIKYMGADRGGSGGLVVNVASMAGIFPMAFGPVYTASKHGVIGLTKAWANERSYLQHKVKIAALCPQIVDTDIIKVQPDQVTSVKLAEKIIASLGIVPMENVTEAFMRLIEDEESNGKILTVTTQKGIEEYKYLVRKALL